VDQPQNDPSSSDPAERALRAFVRARTRGDGAAMHQAWTDLLTAEWARVRTIVQTFRDPSLPGGRVPEHDRDDVIHDAFVRLQGILMKGSSIGEARAIVRTATTFALKEYVRQHVRHDKRRAGSFDETGPDGEGSSAFVLDAEVQVAEWSIDESELAELREAIDRALERVDDNKREVVLLMIQGYAAAEISGRLGISEANVYQLNRRGLTQLRDALKDAR
jgi:RNA polymerase sigma factor (sigma-70 family)